jgi:hypothetical protein
MLIQLFVTSTGSCILNSHRLFSIGARSCHGRKYRSNVDPLDQRKVSEPDSYTSAKITGSSSASKLDLPPTLTQGTFGGYGTPASTTPYQATWSYSPDGGATLLTFTCSLSGSRGIQIVPSKTGPAAGNWVLSEEPRLDRDAWLIRFYYA